MKHTFLFLCLVLVLNIYGSKDDVKVKLLENELENKNVTEKTVPEANIGNEEELKLEYVVVEPTQEKDKCALCLSTIDAAGMWCNGMFPDLESTDEFDNTNHGKHKYLVHKKCETDWEKETTVAKCPLCKLTVKLSQQRPTNNDDRYDGVDFKVVLLIKTLFFAFKSWSMAYLDANTFYFCTNIDMVLQVISYKCPSEFMYLLDLIMIGALSMLFAGPAVAHMQILTPMSFLRVPLYGALIMMIERILRKRSRINIDRLANNQTPIGNSKLQNFLSYAIHGIFITFDLPIMSLFQTNECMPTMTPLNGKSVFMLVTGWLMDFIPSTRMSIAASSVVSFSIFQSLTECVTTDGEGEFLMNTNGDGVINFDYASLMWYFIAIRFVIMIFGALYSRYRFN